MVLQRVAMGWQGVDKLTRQPMQQQPHQAWYDRQLCQKPIGKRCLTQYFDLAPEKLQTDIRMKVCRLPATSVRINEKP